MYSQEYEDHPKHLLKLLAPLMEEFLKHPAVEIESTLTEKQLKNKKLLKRLQEGSRSHNLIYNVRSAHNELVCCYILGMNEVVVTPALDYTAKVLASLDFFIDQTKIACKGSQEVNQYYKSVFQ